MAVLDRRITSLRHPILSYSYRMVGRRSVDKVEALVKVFLLHSVVFLSACSDVTVEQLEEQGRTLCKSDYQLCVDPVLHAKINGLACSASGCHDQLSGSGGGFKLFVSPVVDSTEMEQNFITAKAFANLDDPVNSKLLLEPLQGISAISGTHTGGDIFPGANDPCYRAMLSWIAKRVDAEDSPACGCTPVELSACGF